MEAAPQREATSSGWLSGAYTQFGLKAWNAARRSASTETLAGAAYLIYLGAQSLAAALTRRRHGHTFRSVPAFTPPRALRRSLLSNLGNPKMAVFFASLLPQFAPESDASFADLLALGLVFCAMTFAWLALYAAAISRVGRLLTGTLRRGSTPSAADRP